MTSDAIDTAVRQAREVMDGFMVAFNAEDADAMRKRWFNYPHVLFHSGRVQSWNGPRTFTALSGSVWVKPKAGRVLPGITCSWSTPDPTRSIFESSLLVTAQTVVQWAATNHCTS